MTTPRQARPLTAVALAAALALAGCAQQPGTAAVVEGQRITESYLAATVADFAPLTGSQVTPAETLQLLVQGPVLVDAASRHGVGVSDQQAEEFLAAVVESQGIGDESDFSEGMVLIAKMSLAGNSLATVPDSAAVFDQIAAEFADLGVTVNPRYGQWDPSGAIIPTVFDFHAQPVPGVVE